MKIIILPGLDGSGTFLEDLSSLFKKDYPTEIIKYPTNLYKYSDIREWLSKVLPDQDYIIIAESFSGPIAIQIAASQPAYLKGLICFATFASPPRRIPSWLLSILKFIPMQSKLFVYLSLPFTIGKFAPNGFAQSMYEVLQTLPKTTLIGRVKEVLNVAVQSELQKIHIPCAYINATQDQLLSQSISNDFQKDHIEYMELEGPHFILQSRPAAAHEMIMRFIAKHDLRSSI